MPFLPFHGNSGALLLSLFVVLTSHAEAQPDLSQSDALPDFSTLGTPTSPAFILLGIESSAVERPATPADFAARVLNATGGFSALPQNFAIEIAPYWIRSRPTLTWSADVERSPQASLARTFTVSAATAQFGTEEASVTGLSVAFSTSPFSGRVSAESIEKIRRLEGALADFSEGYIQHRNEEVERLLSEQAIEIRASPDSAAAIQARYEPIIAQAEAAVAVASTTAGELYEQSREQLDEYADFALDREGFFWNVVGGAAWAFPEQVVEAGELARWGLWSSVSYESGPWSPIGVLRYVASEGASFRDDRTGDFLDLGARLIYTTGAFGISAEYVFRRLLDDNGDDADQYRLVGAVEYSLSEYAWLIASFGRDQDADRRGSLVAQLGLSFNISRDRYRLSD